MLSSILLWLAIILLTSAGLLALALLAMYCGLPLTRERETGDPSALGLPFETVSISTVANKSLFGWWMAHEHATQTAIVLHGWGANAELMLPLGHGFYRAGLNVLLFDVRNHGRSAGDTYSSMVRFAEDLSAAMDWLRVHHAVRAERLVLVGHSVGAAACIYTASTRRDVDALISVSAFAHSESLMTRHWQHLRVPRWAVRWLNRYVEWMIGHRFDAIAPQRRVQHIPCPLLLIHGSADEVIPVTDAYALRDAAHAGDINVVFHEIPQANHAPIEQIEQQQALVTDFLRASGFAVKSTNG